MLLEKDLFIEEMESQAYAKLSNADRRRRLDGKLELATLEIFKDLLPNVVDFTRGNKNNNIKQDYINKNILKNYSNIHLFNNNTSYIVVNNNYKCKYYNLVIVKATYQGCVRIPSNAIVNERLTLTEILNLLNCGIAKEYSNLNEILGL